MLPTIVPRDSELYGTLHQAATDCRCVFFAGLPGVGKSLLLQQLSLIAGEVGRRVHLLQWDVARGPFETPEILARYPETDGATHPVIRKAAGVWARETVGAWQRHFPDPRHVLIGEVPLIGSRLIELVQRHADAVEPLLAGAGTLFLIPVPSREVRQVIEAARVREMAAPSHERERANAVPSLVRSLWEEVAAVARELIPLTPRPAARREYRLRRHPLPHSGAGEPSQTDTAFSPVEPGESVERDAAGGYDPEVYAAVYERLLRHRHAARLDIMTALPVQASVYDARGDVQELTPTPDEVARVMAEVGAQPEADVERAVASWFRL